MALGDGLGTLLGESDGALDGAQLGVAADIIRYIWPLRTSEKTECSLIGVCEA